MTQETIEIQTAPLDHAWTELELRNQCQVIYGGVAWPTKRPGFAVVTAMGWQTHFETFDIGLLAEYESFDTRELVRQCGVLDAQFKPALWVGDNRDAAADRFIQEMLSEKPRPKTRTVTPVRRSFCVCPTLMLEMDSLYPYILPHLKRLLDPQRRTLFLKTSKVLNYLAAVEQTEVASMPAGEYPAIEALAFAVITMREHYPAQVAQGHLGDETNLADSYAWPKTPFD